MYWIRRSIDATQLTPTDTQLLLTNMNSMTNKMKRTERKKKKLAALIEITELNNKDRVELEPSKVSDQEGDHSEVMVASRCKHTDKKNISNIGHNFSDLPDGESKMSEMRRDSPSNQGELVKLDRDPNIGNRKSNKKQKSKHQEECDESVGKIKDEWPIPSTTFRCFAHNKKSTLEAKFQKERPVLEPSKVSDQEGYHFEVMEASGCTHNYKKNITNTSHSFSDSPDGEHKMSEMQRDSPSNLGELVDLGRDPNIGHRDSNKKRKSKYQEECDESKTIHSKKLVAKVKDRDKYLTHGWYAKIEKEIPEERPEKMVKCHRMKYEKLSSSRSYGKICVSDDLSSYKEMERIKIKENKYTNRAPFMPSSSKQTDSDPARKSQNYARGDQASTSKAGYETDLGELRKLLKERRKILMEIPMVRLKGEGKEADLDSIEQRTPILPCNVQSFILFSQLGLDCLRFPRWIELRKFNRLSKTVVLVVDGASSEDYLSNRSSYPTLHKMEVKAEMVSPYRYSSTIVEELCAVALTRQQKRDLEKRFGKEICPEALLSDRIIKVLHSAFSITCVSKAKSEEVEKKILLPQTDVFNRTDLLLNPWQLFDECYPLPYGEHAVKYPDYVMTKHRYTAVTSTSPMWGLDCEMCQTTEGSELTRVSLVNEQHKIVYESLCLPANPIINYLTEFSGITPDMLVGVTTTLKEIQKDLQVMLPTDVILVGHSLGGDLHALKMMHPYVIDTSVIFNLTGTRKRKSKLSKLTLEFLNEVIQQRGADGHDSVEDSLAALKLVQHKLTKGIDYGDAVLTGQKEAAISANNTKTSPVTLNSSNSEHHAEELKIEVGPSMATSLFKHITMRNKTVTAVGKEEVLAKYTAFLVAAHRDNKQLVRTVTTDSNVDTIMKTCRECKNNTFTLSHVVLGDNEGLTQVDSWMKKIIDSPPCNSLFILVLAGSHNNFSNGACLVRVKKPNLKLRPRKAD